MVDQFGSSDSTDVTFTNTPKHQDLVQNLSIEQSGC